MGKRKKSTSRKILKWLIKGNAARIVTWLDRTLEERPRRVVFGSDGGRRYADNPRNLFEHLCREPGWDPYWVTSSRAVLAEVNAVAPGRALWWLSPRSLWIALRARFLVISHSRQDVLPVGLSAERKYIHLTHGTPLKTMGLRAPGTDPAYLGRENETVLAMISCSDFCSELWHHAYGMPLEKLRPFGFPRNDLLFQRTPEIAAVLPTPPAKIILYAPTYREWTTMEELLPVPGLNIEQLVTLLERHNAYLLLRSHYFESDATRSTIASAKSSRVIDASSAIHRDVNALLPFVDVLVTDYSSIYFDYLLLDRPIIFTPWDVDQYVSLRGLMIDYDANTPGMKATTPDGFLSALENELAGADPMRDQRALARRRFHNHADERSSERIAAFMIAAAAEPG